MASRNDLREYIGILWHWAWLLVLAAVLAGTVGYTYSSRQPPVYQASTTISIQEAPSTNASAELQSIMLSQQRIQTYAQLMTAKPLLETVSETLGLTALVSKEAITVAPVRDTQLIRVNVRDSDPARAAQIANTLVTVFADQRRQIQTARYSESKTMLQQQLAMLETQIERTSTQLNALGGTTDSEAEPEELDPASAAQRDRLDTALAQYRETYASLLQSFEQVRLAEAQATSTVILEEPAEAPTLRLSPRVSRATLIAALMGLLAAAGLVLLKEHFDDTVKDPGELAELLNLPVLGLIARARRVDKEGPVVVAEPRSPAAESFRALRTNIEFTSVDRPLRTLLVTSPSPNDGKSTMAVNLAAVMAQGGHSVILLDADLRRPTVHKRLELTNRGGLSELFVQPNIHLNGAVRHTAIESVSAVTAGLLPPNPAELLGSQKMQDILVAVKAQADIIVVDSPPINAVTDAAVLAQRVDGVLLVVRAGSTRLGACLLAVDQLRRVGAHVLGIVVNDIPLGRAGYGYAYQGYYKYYRDPEHDSGNRLAAGLRKWRRRKDKPVETVSEKS